MKSISESKIFCACLLVSIVLPNLAYTQKLNVNFDYATFRYDSTMTYIELYYGFNASSLRFEKAAGNDSAASFVDSLKFDVSVRKADSIVVRQIWKSPVLVPDTTQEYLRKNFVGKIDFVLPSGNYRLIVRCDDRNDPQNQDSLSSDLPIPSYSSDRLESSSIELCSTIMQGDGSGAFYKNTYNVVPNPSAIYGVGMPIIYYYLEVYNIPAALGDSLFSIGYEIHDSFGQVQKTFSRTKKKFGTSSVEVGTINGSNLKTGAYTLTFTVIDSGMNSYTTTSRKFFIYNPNLGKPEVPDSNLTSSSILSTVYASMGEKQLDNEFAEARYISTSEERDQYEALKTVESKRQFLYEFWKKREPNQVSKVNEVRTQYLERVVYANSHFRAGVREGWQTDRGRVYIMYGNPDEIDRHPNETNSKPYEIWYYNSLEGGVSFDFVDRTGFGEYMLVNSTKRNEIHDDSWQRFLMQ